MATRSSRRKSQQQQQQEQQQVQQPDQQPKPIEDFVYEQALPLVMKQLGRTDELNARMTSKLWNQVIIKNDKWSFKVCNDAISIDAFKNLSQLSRYSKFYFENLNLEASLFGNQEVFRRFSTGHCLKMKCLTLKDCSLGTGRFLELLSFCKELKKLCLWNVPSIYAVAEGIGVLHWTFCFNHLRKVFAKLHNLSIVEKHVVSDTSIFGLAKGMTNLKQLIVRVDGMLPMSGINEVLKACSKSLASLYLVGGITAGFNVGEVEMEELKILSVQKSNMMSYPVMHQFVNFLGKCPRLQNLYLQHSFLTGAIISRVTNTLTSLHLLDCDLIGDFDGIHFLKLGSVKLQCSSERIDEPAIFEHALESFMKCTKPKLSYLELKFSVTGCSYLKYLDVQTCPKLKNLLIVSSIDVSGKYLRQIFKDFQGLEGFSLKDCGDVMDETLCSTEDCENASLAALQNLKKLNLGGTKVSNKTVLECIVKMKKLEHVNLEETQVDNLGLKAIVDTVLSLKTLNNAKPQKPIKAENQE